MISIKTDEDLAVMRENGRLLAEILEELVSEVRPSRTTAFFNRLAAERIAACGAESAFDRLAGFPGVINASLNEEVVHGVPSEERMLNRRPLLD